jgi:hypothetical protein
MAGSDMKVIQKYIDMTKYVYVILRNFPKAEKYAIAEDIRHLLFNAGSLLLEAGEVPASKKLKLLEQADMEIKKLKFWILVSMEMGLFPFEKYKIFCGMVTEIGKMLGGWIKSSSSRLA